MEAPGPTATLDVAGAPPRTEHHLGSLLQAVHDAVLFASAERRVLDANPAFERLMGHRREDILGRPTRIIHVDDDHARRLGERIASAIAERSTLRLEFPLRRADGSVFPADLSLTPVWRDGAFLGTIGVIRDMSDAKRHELELDAARRRAEESEARWRSLVENAADHVFLADREGRIQHINRGGYGETQDGIVGRPVYDFLAPADRERARETIAQVLATGAPASVVTSAGPGRGARWYEMRVGPVSRGGRVEAVTVTAIDITERLQLEEEAEEHRSRLAALADAQSEMGEAIAVETPHGIAWANAAFYGLVGYDPEDVHAAPFDFWSLVPDEDAPLDAARRVRGSEAERFETRLRRKDGRIVPVEVSRRAQRAGDGERVVMVLRDITDRKQREEAVRRQRDEYEGLLRAQSEMGDGLVITTGGRVAWANDAYCRITGYRREELLAPDFPAAALSAPDAEAPAPGARAPEHYETRLRRKDGHLVDVEVSATAQGEDRIVSIVRDISERKAQEAELRASQDRFRALADTLPQMVWYARPDGYIEWANRVWHEYTGQDEQTVRGEGWALALHPEDLPRTLEAWSRATSLQAPYEVLYRFRRASDGEYRWHLGRAAPLKDAEGRVLRWFGTCTDIHDQKTTEDALRASEERFRLLALHTPVGVYLTTPEGLATYVNPACSRICGFSPEEAAGTGWAASVHPEDREGVLRDWMDYAQAGTAEYHGEFRWRHKDGSMRWCVVRAAPLRSGDRLIGHVGTVEDITDVKLAAEEVSLARAQLAQSEKMSALGSLVGGVAHELRTPLTALQNNLSLLHLNLMRVYGELPPDRATPVKAKLDARIADAQEGVDRINRLVESLRRYTKLRPAGDRVHASLDVFVSEAVDLFRAARRGRVEIVDDLQPTSPIVGDRVELQQVVLNLLENALDARPADNRIRIATREEAGEAVLLVEDDGEGIPAEVEARMWDPFYTTKPDGTGLGLSIVRRIVETHAGSISCDTAPGKGTRFRIAFRPA